MPEPVRRDLEATAELLFAPLLRRSGLGTFRVLSLDAEQGLSLVVEHGAATLLLELEDRDLSRPCFGRTGRFNVTLRHLFERERPIEAASARLVESIVRMVRRREARIPEPDRPTTGRSTMVREILVDRILMPEGRGQYYLNPYVGCTIGCPFCWVAGRADLSRRLEGLPRMPWGRYLDVKINAAGVLRSEVERLPAGPVRMSPILTDPYQPAERRYRITRQCLEVLLEAGFAPVVLTRCARVTDDLELLCAFPRAAVGLSVPTDNDRSRLFFEPGADPISERLAALEACRRAGLATFAVVQPMLPMDPERLAALLSPLVDAVRIDRMHSMEQARPLYEAGGQTGAAEPAFFERTERALRAAFAARGVPTGELDDLFGLLGLR